MPKSIDGKLTGPGHAAGAAPVQYTKEQLVRSGRYRDRRDVLSAVLEEGRGYSLEEAEEAMARFMEGKVG